MNPFAGVYAALLTPRTNDGELDLASYRRQVQALDQHGLSGFGVNGATGEFTLSSEDELERLLAVTREAAPNTDLLCGIGAPDSHSAIRRGRLAAAAGARAVLLPMPSFFPYRQDDLKSFIVAVASEIELPVLLYNLPQFTSGLEVETVLSLLSEHPNLVGIKDSSGSLDIMRAMTREKIPAARLVGNDSALCDALAEGLCDGVVSGVACVLPELLLSLFAATAKTASFVEAQALLDEYIHHIASLPTPWGLKITSAVREYTRESYPFPHSPARGQEASQLRDWFARWYKTITLNRTGAA